MDMKSHNSQIYKKLLILYPYLVKNYRDVTPAAVTLQDVQCDPGLVTDNHLLCLPVSNFLRCLSDFSGSTYNQLHRCHHRSLFLTNTALLRPSDASFLLQYIHAINFHAPPFAFFTELTYLFVCRHSCSVFPFDSCNIIFTSANIVT